MEIPKGIIIERYKDGSYVSYDRIYDAEESRNLAGNYLFQSVDEAITAHRESFIVNTLTNLYWETYNATIQLLKERNHSVAPNYDRSNDYDTLIEGIIKKHANEIVSYDNGSKS